MLVALSFASSASAQAPQSRFADVNGVKLHYLVAGKGSTIVLVHGYTQTSRMSAPSSWRPGARNRGLRARVIAAKAVLAGPVDLRTINHGLNTRIVGA
jgi:hypothetical protein